MIKAFTHTIFSLWLLTNFVISAPIWSQRAIPQQKQTKQRANPKLTKKPLSPILLIDTKSARYQNQNKGNLKAAGQLPIFSKQDQQRAEKQLLLKRLVSQLLWYIRSKQYKIARPILNTLKKKFPHSHETDYFVGLYNYNKGKYSLCLELLTRATAKKVDFSRAWNLRGITLSKLDRHSEALHDFQKAIEFNRYHPDYSYNLAVTFYTLGKYKKALEKSKQASLLKPNFSTAFYLQALIHYAQGKLKASLACFAIAEDFGQKGDEFFTDYLRAAQKLKNHQEAIRIAGILSKKQHKSISILRILGQVWRHYGEYKKAKRFLSHLSYQPQAKHNDREDYVYVLVQLGQNPYKPIMGLPIGHQEKKALLNYSQKTIQTKRRQELLKTVDPIL